MNQILQMLKQYQTQTVFDKKNALKEAIDLWGPDFFISITEKLDFQ